MLGTSASSVEEARAGERLGAAYIGAGPVWATPSKPDADPPIGLDGLRRDLRGGLDSRRRNRRHRRDERRGLHRGGRGGGRRRARGRRLEGGQ